MDSSLPKCQIQVPSFPQIVGFNPSISKLAQQPLSRFSSSPHTPPSADDIHHTIAAAAAVPSRRSISPRSALQTLVVAAKQIMKERNDGDNTSMIRPFLETCDFLSRSDTASTESLSQISNHSSYSHVQTNEEEKQDTDSVESHQKRRCLCKSIATNSLYDQSRPANKPYVEERQATHIEKGCVRSPCFLILGTSPTANATTMSPTINFLDSCYLCKRPLGHGLDIFMYRGDTAFCSVECRYQQILMDEFFEKQSPSVLKSGSAFLSKHSCQPRSLALSAAAAIY